MYLCKEVKLIIICIRSMIHNLILVFFKIFMYLYREAKLITICARSMIDSLILVINEKLSIGQIMTNTNCLCGFCQTGPNKGYDHMIQWQHNFNCKN